MLFSFLTGVVSFFVTIPFIRNTLLLSVAFEVMVIDLFIGPILLVAYFTSISPLSPGLIGFFGQVGTVQPQDPLAFEIINGSFPVFLNLKVRTPSAFSVIVP